MFISKEMIINEVKISNYFDFKKLQYEKNGHYRRNKLSEPVLTYRLVKHDSLVFIDDKFWWHSKTMNGDIFTLVMELEDIGYRDAFRTLCQVYRNKDNLVSYLVERETRKWNYGSGKINNVIAYLCQKRNISIDTINFLIDSKFLEVDENNNACFAIKDYIAGDVVGYEKHGVTDKRYKNTAENTEYGVGFNIVIGKPEKAVFFESAIDLISYWQLKYSSLGNVILVSMGGRKDNIIDKVVRDLDIEEIMLAVDNDDAGNSFIKKVMKEMDDISIKVDIPDNQLKDWNDTLIISKPAKRNKYTF